MMRVCLIFIMGVILTSSVNDSVQELSSIEIQEFDLNIETQGDIVLEQESVSDIFIEAEKITGCPAEILRGIAGTESHFTMTAVGDKGKSHGMFQLHNRWHDFRVEKYGEFDPFDPAEAAVIAGYIVQENLRLCNGDLRRAIAAYRQGVTGVNQNGVIDWYVEEVLSWRKDQKKVIAFFAFLGITEVGRIEDGHIDFGPQIAYKSDDTIAVQISWRGSSGLPY